MFQVPALIAHRIFLPSTFEGVHAQVGQEGRTQLVERLLPHLQAFRLLLQKGDFPVAVAQGGNIAVIRPIDEFLARPFTLTLERRSKIIAVEVDLISAVADGLSL